LQQQSAEDGKRARQSGHWSDRFLKGVGVVCGAFGVIDLCAAVLDFLLVIVCIAANVEPGFPMEDTTIGELTVSSFLQAAGGVTFLWAAKTWWKGRPIKGMALTAVAWLLGAYGAIIAL
jgi:hypothetical protein